jgi:hypothetical protein
MSAAGYGSVPTARGNHSGKESERLSPPYSRWMTGKERSRICIAVSTSVTEKTLATSPEAATVRDVVQEAWLVNQVTLNVPLTVGCTVQ